MSRQLEPPQDRIPLLVIEGVRRTDGVLAQYQNGRPGLDYAAPSRSIVDASVRYGPRTGPIIVTLCVRGHETDTHGTWRCTRRHGVPLDEDGTYVSGVAECA